MKPNINSVEAHPQMSNNAHPVDGALVGAGSLWPRLGKWTGNSFPLGFSSLSNYGD